HPSGATGADKEKPRLPPEAGALPHMVNEV
ncbi:MAG: hypothetical protein QOH86_939, partial [Sphingomonadales bacterium]|nr:hypothetical protein [Sphingomonadales bacterium]